MKLKMALILSGVVAVSGCGGSSEDSNPPETYIIPGNQTIVDPTSNISDSSLYNDLGVHDPSIIKVDGTYYVFGSHLAAAKTTDLMTWEYISSLSANNAVDESPLFDTYSSEIAEGIAWTDGFKGNWAADVIESPDGKFWFYYNHCAQDNPDTPEVDEVCWNRSYLGLAVSDNIDGPYVDQGIFVRSGHRDGELDTYPIEGVEAYIQAQHPNAIDPAAFYDKDDNLWLVYGSYSGGIFILAMDESTGMPEAGQGFGTHLVGGNFEAIEGSYVIYSPESDYYYLFWSNAGFAADDGYNIRVARSRTPQGPYLDADGNNVTGATVANNYGTKLLGSVLWESAFGDPSAQYGYNSPGHNSALYDEELGKYLLFTHTRFPVEEERYDNVEAHAVRVHEMWLNNDDWLVVSPHRYAPIDGDNLVDANDVAGDYRLILQGKDSNGNEHTSVYVTLTNQGRYIQGDLSGVYKLFSDDSDRIRLVINDDTTYEGVAKWQWNVEDERFEVTISAMSASGESLLAAKLPEKTAADIVNDINAAVEETFANEADPSQTLVVKQNLEFPVNGARGAQISWSSSLPRYIANDGTVTRPNVGEGDQTVTLTATIDVLGQTMTVTKDVIVAERSTYNRTAYYPFENSLSEINMTFGDGVASTDTTGTTTVNPVFVTGKTGQAVNLDGSFGVLLPPDIIDSYQYTVSFWMNQQASFQFRPAYFAARSPDRWQSFLPSSWNAELMLWSNWLEEDGSWPWLDGVTGVVYPVNEWHHIALSVNAGQFQIYYDGEQVGSGSGLEDMHTAKPDGSIITLGLNYWDAPLVAYIDEMKVYDEALSAAEIKALDVDELPADQLLTIAEQALDLGNLDFVLGDLVLPYSGPFASALAWESSNSAVIDPATGVVTRPERGEADVTVTLTATITLDGETTSKEFVATVISKTPPSAVARFSFEENLEDTAGDFGSGEPADKTAELPLITPTDKTLAYVDGVVGSAVNFLGDAGPGAKLPDGLISDNSYSISIWLNPTSKTQFTSAFFGYAASNSWISLAPFGPSGQTMLWSGEAWFDGNMGSLIPDNEWTHIVVVVNERTFNAYINGELTNSLDGFPDVFTPVGGNSSFALATNLFPWDANFNGKMDELVIFDDPISIDDVQELYAEGSSQ
ncbi:LamG-like jellyroll fold domain-containing protein [Aliiglaciecola lipolytica]|uniref:Beta-xylosidase-like protein n=1 Tax=Aliiglaciecola lipolytica E3 TaxID=1127673 RepID=K6YZ49_9ALTE|nr:LamG-like jellyroll fold domain-containing protein [Aliiglaciecola lipolytica]GAC16485.1 beta-xylosidase-like protein [Aliiglaciecola lipolytica E3]